VSYLAPAISIIVPVYEAKSTLERCVNSLIDEEFTGQYEIILVDDGSRDGSGVLCDTLRQRYPSLIHVVHQENVGVSAARNAGIDIAAGTYLSFVDSDDYVTSDFVRICASMTRSDSDIIFFDYVRERSGTRHIVKPPVIPNDLESARLLALTCESNSPCTKLYKRALCKGVRFPLGQSLGEDLIFNLRFLAVASSAAYIPDAMYVYVENDGSRTESEACLQDVREYELMLQGLLDFCSTCRLGDQGRNLALSSMRRVIANYAARLRRQGFNKLKIARALGSIERIQDVIDASTVGWKDVFRRAVLSHRLYSLASFALKGK
jgi:glycosyltransferase involved in cell wall biosynthesis